MKNEKIPVEAVLADPCVSFWLKDAIRALEKRDPVDAEGDAELLLAIAQQRLRAVHGVR